jgi:hypothetical protein
MDTMDNTVANTKELTRGNVYTTIDLKEHNCKFIKKTSTVVFFRNEDNLFVFDLNFYKKSKQFKLLTIMD